MTKASTIACIEANKDQKITAIGRKMIEAAQKAK